MEFKSKMLFSTIAAVVAITGTLSLPHSLKVNAALKPVTGLELSNGQITGTTVDVRGWALNENGVKAVDLYVDGKYVTTEDSYKSRPDVEKCFPDYKDAANSGYDFTVNLAPGKHTIRTYDIGKDGVVIYKEATIDVQSKNAPAMRLELSNGNVIGTKVDVKGWALNESGVKAVDLYVDGKYVTTEDSYKPRPDVEKCFPDYKDAANSGYDFTVNLAPGKHTIRAYDIGNDGAVIYKEATINVQSQSDPVMGLELSDGQMIGESLDVRGWALNESGVKAVDLYVDGKYVRTQDSYELRPDVEKCFPGYKDAANSGYDFKLNLTIGKHTIRVYDIGNDGVVIYKEATINVQSQRSPLIGLELSDGEITGKTLDVRGWALNQSGVKAVDLYVDGKYVRTEDSYKPRPDVEKCFPDYKDAANSGYDFTVNLTPGKHTICVYNIGNDEDIISKQVTINVGRIPRTGLELSNGEKINGPLEIRGWAVNDSGIKAVDVYIDGRYTKTLEADEERPDVVKAFPEYSDQLKCGFDYKMPYLENGNHKITVYGIGNDGTTNCQEANVSIENDLDTKIGFELHDNETVGQIADVRGWAIDANKIRAVDIYVDGKYTKTISQDEFETRPDVMKAFPQYANYGNKDKCGFDYKLQLSQGRHDIKVYAISASNDVVLGYQEANIISQS